MKRQSRKRPPHRTPKRPPRFRRAPAEPEQTAIEPEPVIPWRIAGEVLDTYIVCEDAEKTVWLIDKHAAHERVNFDRFKANLEPIMSQELLTPVVAQFAAAEYTALVGQLALLREFGFACEGVRRRRDPDPRPARRHSRRGRRGKS